MPKSPLIPNKFISPSELSGLPEATPILVGFSGGADSSALLRILCEYGKLTGAPIYAAHINHGIRGDEADRDQAFCQKMADAYGVTLFVLNADVQKAYAGGGNTLGKLHIKTAHKGKLT